VPTFGNGIDRVINIQHPRIFATIRKDASSKISVQLWDSHLLMDAESEQGLKPDKQIDNLSARGELIAGSYGPRMVVYTDDQWVSSIDLESSSDDAMVLVNHFFVPNDWISVLNKLIIGVGRGGEILFAKKSELAVIRRGLEVLGSGGTFNPRRGSARPVRNLAVRSSGSVSVRSLSPGFRGTDATHP
jgi:hypothetical protein